MISRAVFACVGVIASDCIFCKIVRREAPASVISEDDLTMAILDIRPINPGHALVVPKVHSAVLADLPPALGGKVFERAMAVASALRRSGIRCEAVNLHLADGEEAGQEVDHVHIHVIPRFRGDGFGFRAGPDYGRIAERATLDDLAAKVRAVMPHQ